MQSLGHGNNSPKEAIKELPREMHDFLLLSPAFENLENRKTLNVLEIFFDGHVDLPPHNDFPARMCFKVWLPTEAPREGPLVATVVRADRDMSNVLPQGNRLSSF